jgi:hypothetical protein
MSAAGHAALKSEKNLLAIHCPQTTGGQGVDLGVVAIKQVSKRASNN